MARILSFIIAILFSFSLSGQKIYSDSNVSFQDSVLLNSFWINFKNAVNTNNKMKLEALCKFPFYCSPCVSDTTLNGPVTIKVTKNLFKKSQYKLFFSQPVKDAVNDQKELFIPTFDNNDPLVQEGFKFSYTIVAPSTSWEGLQGFIFLKKIDGGYRITGIDTVP